MFTGYEVAILFPYEWKETKKKLRRKRLAHGYWAGTNHQNHITSCYHPQGEFYSLPSHISPQELLYSTIYLDNYMENRALCKSGNACSWLNQNNYHWGNNTVMFSFLNIWKECLVLQDGLKTVSRVSQATEEELIDCSLDHQTAQKVINFFDKDCIQIWI